MIYVLSKKLAKGRSALNNFRWESNSLKNLIGDAKQDKAKVLAQIKLYSQNGTLLENIKDINSRYQELIKKESMWAK